MLTFPYSTLKAKSFRLDLVGQVVSGGVTASGQQQRVNATGGGLWSLLLDFPRLTTANQIRAWRVVQFGSDGGVAPVNVAICDLRQAPTPSGWSGSSSVTHSDGAPFSDSSLYASTIIGAELSASAALRATTIRVLFDGDSMPLGGEFLSLAYGVEMHELHVVLTATATGTAKEFDLTIRPPLRAAHNAGEPVNFDHPTGTFVLAQPDSMSLPTEYGRFGNGTAGFIEYVG